MIPPVALLEIPDSPIHPLMHINKVLDSPRRDLP